MARSDFLTQRSKRTEHLILPQLDISTTIKIQFSGFAAQPDPMSLNQRLPLVRPPSAMDEDLVMPLHAQTNGPSAISSKEPLLPSDMAAYATMLSSSGPSISSQHSSDLWFENESNGVSGLIFDATLDNTRNYCYGTSPRSQSSTDYLVPPNTEYVGSAAACPRSCPGMLDLPSVKADEHLSSQSYPPAMFMMDPERNEPSFFFDKPVKAELATNEEPQSDALSTWSASEFCDDTQEHAQSPGSWSASASPPQGMAELNLGSSVECVALDNGLGENCAQEEIDGEEPYAKLIFRALMSTPNHRMVLRDIYDWFKKNTSKGQDPEVKGWQNSIRHNLSMNGAFKKAELESTPDQGKKGYIWVLSPSAIAEGGVKSTTRYRKTGPAKRASRPDLSAPCRPAPGRKSGQTSKRERSARYKRCGRGIAGSTSISSHPYCLERDSGRAENYGEPFLTALDSTDSKDLAIDSICQSAVPDTISLRASAIQATSHATLADVEGVTEYSLEQPFFYNNAAIGEQSFLLETEENTMTRGLYRSQY